MHLDAGFKRSLDLLVGSAVDGDVEIGADPVPMIAVAVGIAPKRRHDLCTESEPTRITILYYVPVTGGRQASA